MVNCIANLAQIPQNRLRSLEENQKKKKKKREKCVLILFAFSQVYLIVIFIRTNNIFIICIMMYFTMFNTMIKIIYIKKRRGPRTEFRGSPCRMVALVESNITWFASLAYNIMSKIIIFKIDDKMIWSTECVPLTISYHLYFFRISKVLSMLLHVSVRRVSSKEYCFIFTYTFLAFFGFFLSKCLCFYHFHICYWWKIELP